MTRVEKLEKRISHLHYEIRKMKDSWECVLYKQYKQDVIGMIDKKNAEFIKHDAIANNNAMRFREEMHSIIASETRS